ncbi:hypothetical protein ACQ4PT_036684 [Festuca glaucescens]
MVRSFLEDGGGGVGGAGRGRALLQLLQRRRRSDDEDGPRRGRGGLVTAPASASATSWPTCLHARRAPPRGGGRASATCSGLLAASLLAMGHDAALCLSRWDKSSSHPAGEHAYVDVLLPAGSERVDRERVIVDVDFRSQFEVARPHQGLPRRAAAAAVGVRGQGGPPAPPGGRGRGLGARQPEEARPHLPPWRKPEYMRAKWLSPYEREVPPPPPEASAAASELADVGEGGGDGNTV